MAISDSEKLDRILKAYVLEVQSWASEEFKYAMAWSNFIGEMFKEDSAELIFVMRKKPRDFACLSNRITKLTARYSRRYKITLQPAFRWEEEDCCEAVEI